MVFVAAAPTTVTLDLALYLQPCMPVWLIHKEQPTTHFINQIMHHTAATGIFTMYFSTPPWFYNSSVVVLVLNPGKRMAMPTDTTGLLSSTDTMAPCKWSLSEDGHSQSWFRKTNPPLCNYMHCAQTEYTSILVPLYSMFALSYKHI